MKEKKLKQNPQTLDFKFKTLQPFAYDTYSRTTVKHVKLTTTKRSKLV